MAAVSLTQQQYQQFIDRISGLEARMATLQTHAEAQQEQIRVAEIVIQPLRTNPANPPPPSRATFQRLVTEGGVKALTKYTVNHSEYHDWSFSARRVLTRADERFAGLLLEVDPWSDVELVPYLCAVSLNSSCEEFAEPKRMSRGAHFKTSQSGSPRNFAHVNKFSILAPDDKESPGECCASKHTSRIRCQQRVDECRPRIRYIEAERSSSFVPGGVRRRQQRSPPREWIWLEKIERDHGLGFS